MSILFINGSPNKGGMTARIAYALLQGKEFETMNIIDYQINCYGQNLKGDQFDEVLNRIKGADVLVIGSPMYWHNICGSIRNLLDRFYGRVEPGELLGKKLYFILQGEAPEQWMLDVSEYTMERFAQLYGLEYMGMASNENSAYALNEGM